MRKVGSTSEARHRIVRITIIISQSAKISKERRNREQESVAMMMKGTVSAEIGKDAEYINTHNILADQ